MKRKAYSAGQNRVKCDSANKREDLNCVRIKKKHLSWLNPPNTENRILYQQKVNWTTSIDEVLLASCGSYNYVLFHKCEDNSSQFTSVIASIKYSHYYL